MKITVAYNLRTEKNEQQAELLFQEDVDRICKALEELKHKIIPVEVSGKPNEEILAGHVLLRLQNVYITPHSAFNTKEAVQRILNAIVDNILAFTQGRPQNLVSGNQ